MLGVELAITLMFQLIATHVGTMRVAKGLAVDPRQAINRLFLQWCTPTQVRRVGRQFPRLQTFQGPLRPGARNEAQLEEGEQVLRIPSQSGAGGTLLYLQQLWTFPTPRYVTV